MMHTPGPWTVEGDWDAQGNARYTLIGAKYSNAPDARLIAAAPEMLEALKGIREHAVDCLQDCFADMQEGGTGHGQEKWQAVIDAIAKAEAKP